MKTVQTLPIEDILWLLNSFRNFIYMRGGARVNENDTKKWLKGVIEANEHPELSCALCGYFCNNAHHHNNWFEVKQQPPTIQTKGGTE